jgi:hypothetical protein
MRSVSDSSPLWELSGGQSLSYARRGIPVMPAASLVGVG